MSKLRPNSIVMTPGEPAGCGPDITIMLAQQVLDYPLIVIADPDVLRERALLLGLPLIVEEIADVRDAKKVDAKHLQIFPVKVKKAVRAGELCSENAGYVLHSLDIAIQLCLQKQAMALITGPVHKALINQAGISFSGHTHYLAEKTQTKEVVMFFVSEKLSVALVTDHLPLREVAPHITRERISAVIRILNENLKLPRLAVCGLNPHAGEGGYLGHEEQEIITPVLEKFRQQGYFIVGPISADTAFTDAQLSQSDVIIAMYHDQALPVLKQQSFGHAVNITLGLPFLRTSVDHGTALALAGTGQIDDSSLKYVYHKTIEMIHASST